MIHDTIEMLAVGIEVLSVLIIAGGIVNAIFRYLLHISRQSPGAYKDFKERIGNSLLLGLELLVAADIVRTVALTPTIQSVITLALLVLVRTFISWSLVVEIEGRWPWQIRQDKSDNRISDAAPDGS
jgi:uncharacterized membrane protein